MTAARPRYCFTPMTMTYAEAADVVFRKSEGWLREHIDEFPGFPEPHPKTRLFHAEQVTIWLRAWYGIGPPPGADDEALAGLAVHRSKYERDGPAGKDEMLRRAMYGKNSRPARKPGTRIPKGAAGWADQHEEDQ